jgi:hypothetical protein
MAVLAAVLAIGTLCGAQARAATPLTFSAPAAIDHPNSLTGISCPSTTLCVAVDSTGNVVVSTNPLGGVWTSRSVNPSTTDTPGGFNAVSCPSTSFCIAVGNFGQAATSTDPALLSSWQLIPMGIDEPASLTGVSCSSSTRCVGVDSAGQAVTTDVAEGQPLIWTSPAMIDTQTTHITGVSCVSTDLCIAVDGDSYAITSTQANPVPPWNPDVKIDPDPHVQITGVSCASITLCVAVDFSGNALVSTDPRDVVSPPPTWTSVVVDPSALAAVSCVSGPLCIVVDGSGRVSVSSDPAGAVESDWFGPTRVDPPSGTPVHSLTAVSCPSAAECVAVDDAGNAVVGSDQHALTVSVAGAGSGTVTGAGISCPTACTGNYLSDSSVALTAHPASGSTFSGWSGGGCSGAGACTTSLSSDQAVTATFVITPPPGNKPPPGKTPPPGTVITHVKTNRHKRSASFRFRATGSATGLQCAKVRLPAARRHHKRARVPKPHFRKCRSPKTYKHLPPGPYRFSVRAVGAGGTDLTPARRSFKIP